MAVSLGPVQVHSYMQEPLLVRVAVTHEEPVRPDQVRAQIASESAFQAMGVPWHDAVDHLRVHLDTHEDTWAVVVTSTQPIAEPFLRFVLDITSPDGGFKRAYTLLLDPRPVPHEDKSHPGDERVADPQPGVHRVIPGQTLWSIASLLRVQHHTGSTLHQIMVGLLQANPKAFIRDNPHALRTGTVLQVPDEAHMQSVSPEDATAFLRQRGVLGQPDAPLKHG